MRRWENKTLPARLITQTFIAPNTKLFGDVSGAGDLELAGTCKGDIQIQGRVSVQGSGLLKGNVHAQEIEVQGAVVGDLRAGVSIILGPSARVVGALTAPRIEVLQGAQFQGPVKSETPEAFVSEPPAMGTQDLADPKARARAQAKSKAPLPDPDSTVVTLHQELGGASVSL